MQEEFRLCRASTTADKQTRCSNVINAPVELCSEHLLSEVAFDAFVVPHKEYRVVAKYTAGDGGYGTITIKALYPALPTLQKLEPFIQANLLKAGITNPTITNLEWGTWTETQ